MFDFYLVDTEAKTRESISFKDLEEKHIECYNYNTELDTYVEVGTFSEMNTLVNEVINGLVML